jgi:predicted phage baseplate assembly protein
MTLALPNLDNRYFQDIVDEAKRRIPIHCREWTDHNVSDPGVTLIELFAWMTELIIYRLNRIPERHYIEFLNLLGINLGEPVPARVPVTFWLTKGLKGSDPVFSTPADQPLTIEAGTEVATTQTETQRPVIFTTDAEFKVQPPELKHMMSYIGGVYRGHRLSRLITKEGYSEQDRENEKWPAIFSDEPVEGDALYFGFETDLSNHIVRFDLNFDPAAAAGSGARPPCVWEASTGEADGWAPCEEEDDTTEGMNRPGRIQIHAPQMGKSNLNQTEYYWIRVRVKRVSEKDEEEGMGRFIKTPRLGKVAVTSWGGTVMATHARKITGEDLGQSDGTPGQRFLLQSSPLLKREEGEHLITEVNGGAQSWMEVPDFSNSGPADRHYTLDSVTGELRFGPAVRQRDGEIRCYGMIPERGARLIFAQYRSGGGVAGNVEVGGLNTLKTGIAQVARVSNRKRPVERGIDSESLEEAMVRAPGLLRSRERAVTRDDFKFLVTHNRDFAGRFARVECVQPPPDDNNRIVPRVYILVVPTVDKPEGRLTDEQLTPRQEHIAALRSYLDERRLLTTRLQVAKPGYRFVSVAVRLQAASPTLEDRVREEVLARLYRFLNPLTGGEEGRGWTVGRDLLIADVYQCLQKLPDVNFVQEVQLFRANEAGNAQGQPVERISVLHTHGMIASGIHTVEFV